MACTTVEGCHSCLYPYQYWMHWSNTVLSCWEPQRFVIQMTQNYWYFSPLYASVLVLVRMFCFFSQGLSQPTTVFCVTNCYAVRDSGTLFTLVIPSSWATVLSVSFLSPLSGHLKGLSLSAPALFCHNNWPWRIRLSCSLIFIDHWLHIIVLSVHYFSHLLSFPPLLPDWHTYVATLTLNSTPCCPPARLFPPPRSLLSSLLLPPVLISSLQGESQWDWEAEAKQDDRLHHRIVGHGAHLQRTSTETGQTNHSTNGCVPHEVAERKWQHQHRWVI